MEQGACYYRRWLDGDESAFAWIIGEYRDPVTLFIQQYVHDICAAEDIAADVFMYLVVHPQRFHFKNSLKTYLYTIARSRALDHLRRVKRRNYVPLEDDTLPADEPALEEAVLKNEQKRRLYAAIAELPTDQQIAVHLVYFEEYSYADAARIMKKSAKQVDNLLYRAKLALRDLIGEDGEQEK